MPQPQYATYADLQASLDSVVISQLSSDNGQMSPNALCLIDTILERASSIVQGYARVGNIYLDADLDALATAKDGLLVMVTVAIATEMLFQRRAMKIPPAVEAQLTQARTMLEALRDGKMIFGNVAKAADAGVAEVAATPLWNLAFYNNVSSSSFFPPRRGTTYPGAT